MTGLVAFCFVIAIGFLLGFAAAVALGLYLMMRHDGLPPDPREVLP